MATETTAQRVSTEVKVGMVRQGLTRQQVAKRLGLSLAALSRRLLGEVAFNTNELDALAELLGTTPADLVAERVAS